MRIEKREAKSFLKCTGCGETVRTCEKYLQIVGENGKNVRGERYCVRCDDIARTNNDIGTHDDDDGERGLRVREAYAGYQAAGATSHFFDDLNAGHIR